MGPKNGQAARRRRRAIPRRGPGGRTARALYNLTTKRAAGMASQYRIERDRGTKESAQQFAVLREKWPLAFPVKHQDIRPLAVGVAREIAVTMGWSLPYTLGVFGANARVRTTTVTLPLRRKSSPFSHRPVDGLTFDGLDPISVRGFVYSGRSLPVRSFGGATSALEHWSPPDGREGTNSSGNGVIWPVAIKWHATGPFWL
jgi:hypothetical protein